MGGVIALLEVSAGGLASLVNIKVQLLTVELHGTALEAALTKAFRQLVQGAQFLSIVAILAHQDFLHLFVRVPSITLDDCMCNVVVLDVGVFV